MSESIPSRPGIFSRLAHGWFINMPSAGRSVINLFLLVLWAWLYRPVFQYLAVLFTRQEFRTNQIVLLAVIGLLLYHARKARIHPRADAAPRLFLPGLAMMVCGTLGYLLVERFLDINTVSALLFGLASYGLLGLWLPQERWKQGFPAMLLVVGVLPFGEHLETFVGYPLRVFTAGLVRSGLGALGFQSIGVDTILVFESGISQVDIPCSGVKSLWTGALFLLAATWIENRPINLRWMLVAAGTGCLLIAANLVRVAGLALTGPALGWDLLARMLHIPLGVLGFIGACAAAFTLLDRLPVQVERSAMGESPGRRRWMAQPAWLGPLLVFFVLGSMLLYAPRPADKAAQAAGAPHWSFPAGLQTIPAPLSPQELDWVRQGGAETADRYTFAWQDAGQPVTGTMMLLTSQTWRGQHRPERCFEVFGLTVQESRTHMAAPDFPLRYLTLSGAEAARRVSAAYWLQSASRTTEDFGQRIWADLGASRERWVLVTVLFDQEHNQNSPEINHLFAALHRSIRRSFLEGGEP